ncbi:hypothetical protein NL676_015090 [Syzygium grande]|nr:hypothetical protein NL676_015090 [Syzygium grande]
MSLEAKFGPISHHPSGLRPGRKKKRRVQNFARGARGPPCCVLCHIHHQAVVLTQLHCIGGDPDTNEDEPQVDEGVVESTKGGSGEADLVYNAISAIVEVKGDDGEVDTTRKA